MPKAAGDAAFYFGFGNSPGALTLRATRGLLTTTRYAEPTLYKQVGDMSIDRLNCSGGRVGRTIQAQKLRPDSSD